jgi:hypothetical protein
VESFDEVLKSKLSDLRFLICLLPGQALIEGPPDAASELTQARGALKGRKNGLRRDQQGKRIEPRVGRFHGASGDKQGSARSTQQTAHGSIACRRLARSL